MEDGSLRNGPYVGNSYKWAGGGFLSTPSDLVQFGFALLFDDFLNPKTLAMMRKPMVPTSGKKTNYGLGWATTKDPKGRIWQGHTGGSC